MESAERVAARPGFIARGVFGGGINGVVDQRFRSGDDLLDFLRMRIDS
jgi:hypothetical protein